MLAAGQVRLLEHRRKGDGMTRLEIEAFLAIIKYGSISAAADRLFVTQPALSRRVRSIEEELGYELFDRGRGVRNIELTEEGKEFVSLAENFLNLYREAGEIPDKRRKPTLRISTVNSLAAYLLPWVLPEMTEGENGCNVVFISGRALDFYGYVENKTADVALVSDVVPSKKVTMFPAFEEPYMFAGGRAFEGVSRMSPEKLDPADQIRMPWNPEYEVWHRKWFSADRPPGIVTDRMEFLEAFLRGNKWAVVPRMVAERLKDKDVWLCPLDNGPEALKIYGLTRDGRKNPLVDRFLKLVHREVSSIEGVHSFL